MAKVNPKSLTPEQQLRKLEEFLGVEGWIQRDEDAGDNNETLWYLLGQHPTLSVRLIVDGDYSGALVSKQPLSDNQVEDWHKLFMATMTCKVGDGV
jgi:hypothetical protein